jgi:hypothetical protein
MKYFKTPGSTSAVYCINHKRHGMINVIYKTCELCILNAHFNVEGSTTAQYCRKHKKNNMILIIDNKCELCKELPTLEKIYENVKFDMYIDDQLTNSTSNVPDDLDEFARQVRNAEILKEYKAELEADRPRQISIKKEEDRIRRMAVAETATNIKREDARKDLFLSGETPYLFQKYIKEFWEKSLVEWGADKVEKHSSQWHYQIMPRVRRQAGEEINNLIHKHGCGGANCADPSFDFETYIANGYSLTLKRGSSLDSTFPCVSSNPYNPQGLGRCWGGTIHDGRLGADPRPFKTDLTLPESWK